MPLKPADGAGQPNVEVPAGMKVFVKAIKKADDQWYSDFKDLIIKALPRDHLLNVVAKAEAIRDNVVEALVELESDYSGFFTQYMKADTVALGEQYNNFLEHCEQRLGIAGAMNTENAVYKVQAAMVDTLKDVNELVSESSVLDNAKPRDVPVCFCNQDLVLEARKMEEDVVLDNMNFGSYDTAEAEASELIELSIPKYKKVALELLQPSTASDIKDLDISATASSIEAEAGELTKLIVHKDKKVVPGISPPFARDAKSDIPLPSWSGYTNDYGYYTFRCKWGLYTIKEEINDSSLYSYFSAEMHAYFSCPTTLHLESSPNDNIHVLDVEAGLTEPEPEDSDYVESFYAEFINFVSSCQNETCITGQLRKISQSDYVREDVMNSLNKLASCGYLVPISTLPVEQKELVVDRPGYFIPWRTVHKEGSLSTPVRIVFDASSRTPGGSSLNDALAKGENRISSLYNILLRFRCKAAAFCCDIRLAYNQIELETEHFRYLKFLWQQDLDPDGDVEEYVIRTLIYGVRPVGNSLIAGFSKLCNYVEHHHPQHLAGACTLCDSGYVDDILNSGNSREEAIVTAESPAFVLSLTDFIPQPGQWRESNEDLKEGDIVMMLMNSEEMKLGGPIWKFARVQSVETSHRDGRVRTAICEYRIPGESTMRTTRRSVRKLAVVHQEDDLDLVQQLNLAAKQMDIEFHRCNLKNSTTSQNIKI